MGGSLEPDPSETKGSKRFEWVMVTAVLIVLFLMLFGLYMLGPDHLNLIGGQHH